MRTGLIAAGFLAVMVQQAACKKSGESSSPEGCADKCGRGTRCDGSLCVVDYSQDICASDGPVERPDEVPMKPPITSWGECWEDRNQLPKFKPIDDKKIPQFDPNAVRRLDMNAGEEQLNEPVLMSNMRDVEYEINKCLSLASCYEGSSLKSGGLDFKFRLGGDGKVESVSVTAPPQLTVWGIVPCTRKAIFDHQFPKFDGPAMTVTYSIEIGE
ncbi:MAG: hypothetical protein JNL82_29085 [Myxococcales bacterium]|nr:hypothetical protein [Myxococcales bacterium]